MNYAGRHAALYDLFYKRKPYKEEAAFVVSCFEKYGQVRNVLELACGTGNHAAELARRGYQVVATDHSPDMLAGAKRKYVSGKLRFREMDMKHFLKFPSPFDAVICLFDSIGYLRTGKNIDKAMGNVARNLATGGLFVFEYWHAPAVMASYDPVRVKRFGTKRGEIVRIAETALDLKKKTGKVRYSIYEHHGKDVRYFTETQINRYFTPGEIKKFLRRAGLTPVKNFAGFTFEGKVNRHTWHIVCVARKTA